MTTSAVADVAGTYFEAWQAGDFERVRSVLADDVTFDGPLGHASNADECIAGLKRMSQIVTDIVIRKTFVDGPNGEFDGNLTNVKVVGDRADAVVVQMHGGENFRAPRQDR